MRSPYFGPSYVPDDAADRECSAHFRQRVGEACGVPLKPDFAASRVDRPCPALPSTPPLGRRDAASPLDGSEPLSLGNVVGLGALVVLVVLFVVVNIVGGVS